MDDGPFSYPESLHDLEAPTGPVENPAPQIDDIVEPLLHEVDAGVNGTSANGRSAASGITPPAISPGVRISINEYHLPPPCADCKLPSRLLLTTPDPYPVFQGTLKNSKDGMFQVAKRKYGFHFALIFQSLTCSKAG